METKAFIAKFMDELSNEGLIHGTPAQYRRAYPGPEAALMFAAGKKSGVVPHNLEHAKLILADNVFVLPDKHHPGAKAFDAFTRWPVPNKNLYPVVGVLVMARTMVQFATERPDAPPELMTDATALEKRALDAIAAGVSEIQLATAA